MRLSSSAFFGLILLAATTASAADVAGVDVVDAEFGIFDASRPGEILLTPTTVIPLRPGQRYGWVIGVRTGKRSLSVREEYLLPNAKPGPAPDNPVAANLAVPLERHNQVSQRQLVPVAGQIYGEWAIGPNEPAGRRQLQVVIEGAAAARFEFEVK